MKSLLLSAVWINCVRCILFVLLLPPSLDAEAFFVDSSSTWTSRCPCKCIVDELGRKLVICDEGGRQNIPSHNMDRDAQILIFTAPPDNPNHVTIGRLFLEFNYLQEIHITHSNLPAIGDSSFWPGRILQILDLSNNKISIIRDSDFNGLSNLEVLDLSDNSLVDVPSAAFRFIGNVTRLSLARNKLTRLVPRLFYKLVKLDFLDLSGNPLSIIEPDDFKDVKTLKILHLAKCQLSKLHSRVYQSLPNLEELDLQGNQFTYLAPHEFRYLRKLKKLYIDENKLSTLIDNTFYGHKLYDLSLARNELVSLSSCAFCNASIKQLDLSNNKFTSFQANVLEPLANSLSILNAFGNDHFIDSATSVANLIKPLKVLRKVSLASMALEDNIPNSLFLNQRETLTSVDLSGNKFVNLSGKIFEGLNHLEELDLSSNIMYALSEEVLQAFDNIPTLQLVFLHENPWSCFRCHILPLIDWIHSSPRAYTNACQNDNKGFCVKCAYPGELTGKELHSISEYELEWCADPTVPLRLSATEPNIGLVLALLIIISLIIVIVAVIILYRKQGATYYTHEDERLDDKTVFSVSSTIQRFANATASPPLSPDTPTPSTPAGSCLTSSSTSSSSSSVEARASLPLSPPESLSASPPSSLKATPPLILQSPPPTPSTSGQTEVKTPLSPTHFTPSVMTTPPTPPLLSLRQDSETKSDPKDTKETQHRVDIV